ncbi:50S ribosomal protein L10 [archaeon]|nr:50S ribosomal protein L10 [archaeon]
MVSQKNLKEAELLMNLIMNYPVFGIMDIEGLPSSQLQSMRKALEGKALIRVTKKRILQRAVASLKQKDERFSAVERYIKGMPALIFTKDNPFRLSKVIAKSKKPAYAKPGQISPRDIAVEPQKTNFAPGPIISELAKFGLKAAIEEGKVVIKTGAVVVKEGEIIDAKKSELLMKLGIQPIEIGLNILGLYENGNVYGKDVLEISEKDYQERLMGNYNEAFNLSVYCYYPIKENIKLLIGKTYKECAYLSRKLGEKGIVTSENIKEVIAWAESQARMLKEAVKI